MTSQVFHADLPLGLHIKELNLRRRRWIFHSFMQKYGAVSSLDLL